jgi:hypothetical protein
MAGQPSSDDDLMPPSGLRAPGRRLWTAVAGLYVLTPAELAMLGEACRTADEVDRLERAVRALPELVVSGSTGQPKAHPLLAEVRAHRQLLERLTSALNLPDDDQVVGDRASTKHARTAAQGRWRRKVPTDTGDGEGGGKLAELRAAAREQGGW